MVILLSSGTLIPMLKKWLTPCLNAPSLGRMVSSLGKDAESGICVASAGVVLLSVPLLLTTAVDV